VALISNTVKSALAGSFKLPPLYPILDLGKFEEDRGYLEVLTRYGAGIVQLRGKNIDGAAFERVARELITVVKNLPSPHPLIIINDHPEICRVVGADGVHLGQTDGSPTEARALLGPSAIIGLSTHNIDQVEAAQSEPVNYLGFGPVFISPTKQGHAPVTGTDFLAQACAASAIPVTAIGGVTAESARSVYAAGAASVAVVSDLRKAENVGARIEQYLAAFGASRR
jgi:thiamine-phosphate pyrophosphorylase